MYDSKEERDIQRKYRPLFPLYISELTKEIYSLGHHYTLGDGYRDPRVHGPMGKPLGYGHPYSFHKIRLAQDINLFVNGVLIEDTDHPVYQEIGAFWKSLHPECTWGGDFKKPDGNHFSMCEKRR